MRGTAVLLDLGAVALALGACRPPGPAVADREPVAACPRDATRDREGRCVCSKEETLVLGACVPPPIADAYCGPVARAHPDGACAYPPCLGSDAVDIDTGCLPLQNLLHGGQRSCASGASLVVEDRQLECVSADAACPRGTHAQGRACVHGPSCPAGSLPLAQSCSPVVFRGAGDEPRVDLGAWAALVLGVDGGPGSADLCRPLQARPRAMGLEPSDAAWLRLRIALSAPDNDVTRVSAEVRASVSSGPLAVPTGVATLAEQSVASLLEPLRGLGGETSTSYVEVEVRCPLGTASLPTVPSLPSLPSAIAPTTGVPRAAPP